MLKGKLTYTSLAVALLAGIANHFGFVISDVEQAAVVDFATKAVEFSGLGMAIYGRYRATK